MISTSPKILVVTSADGFVGSHLLKLLLETTQKDEYYLKCTVSSLNPNTLTHLTELPCFSKERVEFYVDNAVTNWNSILQDSYALFFNETFFQGLSPNNLEQELLTPAITKTRRILTSAIECQVSTIIFKSGFSAIADHPMRDKVFTESDWNEISSPSHNPSFFAKTQVEKAAWNVIMSSSPSTKNIRFVVLNPTIVLGPSLSNARCIVTNFLIKAYQGRYPTIPKLSWGIVDVRCLAKAQLSALKNPNAYGRYILNSGVWRLKEITDHFSTVFPNWKLPWVEQTDCFTKIATSFTVDKEERDYIRTQIGAEFQIDTSRSVQDLEIKYTPVDETLTDTFKSLVRWGYI